MAALRHRPARPAQGHPVLHRHHQRPLRRGPRPLDDHHRRRRRHRRPVLRQLRGHALRPDGAPLRGPGQLPRPDPAHVEVARRRHRPRGQARRRRRHRRHRHPGDPDDRRRGRPPHRLRPHPAVHAADEEPALRPGGAGGVQGPVRRAEVDDPAHVLRLRVRLGARLGRLHAREAARGAGGDLRGRLAQAVAGGLRGDVLLPGRQRGDLRVRPRQDAHPPQGRPAPVRRAHPHRLRLRHPPGAAGARLPRGLPPRQRGPRRRARQPDRPHHPERHRAGRRHRATSST